MSDISMFESFVEANREICVVGKPASDELIRLAENFLELTFPRDYRDFLRSLGTLSVRPLEFWASQVQNFLTSQYRMEFGLQRRSDCS